MVRPALSSETVPTVEDCQDAVIEGDRTFAPGSARAALTYPVFRRVFIGAFLSNTGTWMQNVVLGALAYNLTGSSTFVGVMIFAQLGPFLLLSVVGGILADRFDRRRLLIGVFTTQALLSLALAAVVVPDDPNLVLMVAVVFGIGVGQAIFGPTYAALLPQLVSRRDLAGAVALNSTQMNASRVIGPPIGAFLDSQFNAPAVFVGNAATYLFVIGALLSVRLPSPSNRAAPSRGIRALGDGFRIARRMPAVWRSLVIVFLFSLISLPFIGQFPVVAERNLGIDERSPAYGWLYACFGIGAMTGALSIGTVFSRQPKERLGRIALAGFSLALAGFSLLRVAPPAYPSVAVVGLAYFAMITSLSTVIQERVGDQERGRVMALWLMGFAGTVPIGNLLAGPIIEATSVTTVMLAGALCAAGLAAYARFDRLDDAGAYLGPDRVESGAEPEPDQPDLGPEGAGPDAETTGSARAGPRTDGDDADANGTGPGAEPDADADADADGAGSGAEPDVDANGAGPGAEPVPEPERVEAQPDRFPAEKNPG